MNNLISYINSEKNSIEDSINEISEKINKSKYELENIEKKIVEYSKNVDTTYEIFSPNAYDKDYNIVEIRKLNQRKKEVNKDIEGMVKDRDILYEHQKVIEFAYQDYENFQQRLIKEEIENERLMNKKIEELKEEYFNELIQTLEYQIDKDNHFIGNEVVRQLDIIENKLSLCENFVNMDINRAKLEMLKTAEEISYFKKRINSEMFHVKHFKENNRLKLNDEIKKFVNQYKKSINSRVEYKYVGRKIEDKSYNIINLIRIIKESIDNADNHSNGTTISVTVIVDDFFLNDSYEDEYSLYEYKNDEATIDISMFNAGKNSRRDNEKSKDAENHLSHENEIDLNINNSDESQEFEELFNLQNENELFTTGFEKNSLANGENSESKDSLDYISNEAGTVRNEINNDIFKIDINEINQMNSDIDEVDQMNPNIDGVNQMNSDIDGVNQMNSDIDGVNQMNSHIDGINQMNFDKNEILSENINYSVNDKQESDGNINFAELSNVYTEQNGDNNDSGKFDNTTHDKRNINRDMHQINFIINETTDKFNVTIKISDNGDGFNIPNEKLLIENGLFGIYMMKYRTEKMNGKFYIQSNIGIGTTVTVVYEVG